MARGKVEESTRESYQTQVSLQQTGSEPLALGPSFSSKMETDLLASWVAKEKIETLASEMPVSIPR